MLKLEDKQIIMEKFSDIMVRWVETEHFLVIVLQSEFFSLDIVRCLDMFEHLYKLDYRLLSLNIIYNKVAIFIKNE